MNNAGRLKRSIGSITIYRGAIFASQSIARVLLPNRTLLKTGEGKEKEGWTTNQPSSVGADSSRKNLREKVDHCCQCGVARQYLLRL